MNFFLFSIWLNVDNFIFQTLFSFFLCSQLNLLSNLSCVSCDQFPDWIDPGPIFHHCEQPTVSQTRQTYCSSYQSTDLPSFNKISFQFQPFPISIRTTRDVCTLRLFNFPLRVCVGGIIFWCLILLIFWKQQILRRKVFFWIWWEFSSVTSWIDWTNLILYWNSKNFQVLEWNSMLNAKWCDTLFLFLFQSSGWLSLKRRHIPAFNNSKAYPLLRKRGTYFPFQIFKEFLKVQALKDQQVGAWKSKPTFAFQCSHQKG